MKYHLSNSSNNPGKRTGNLTKHVFLTKCVVTRTWFCTF